VRSGAIKRYFTLLKAQPELGRPEHIGWIALMSTAFDDLSGLERDAAVRWMAQQTKGTRQRAADCDVTTQALNDSRHKLTSSR
jgi:hypothetical protein